MEADEVRMMSIVILVYEFFTLYYMHCDASDSFFNLLKLCFDLIVIFL